MASRGTARLALVALLVVLLALQAVAAATPTPDAGPRADGSANGQGQPGGVPGSAGNAGVTPSPSASAPGSNAGTPTTSHEGGGTNGERGVVAANGSGRGRDSADNGRGNGTAAATTTPGASAGASGQGSVNGTRSVTGTAGPHGPPSAGAGQTDDPTRGTPVAPGRDDHPDGGPTVSISHRSDAATTNPGNGPAGPGPAAWGTGATPGERDRGNGSRPGNPGASSVATISVTNAPADVPVGLNVAVESPVGAVGVDTLSMSVESSRSYTLEVAANDTAFSTTPAFDVHGAPSALGFVRVNHSVSNPEIGTVTFTVRVSKDRLAHDELDQVALYRHHRGSWHELETTLVGETTAAYVFRAHSPGLSEFVVGKKEASFDVTSTHLESTAVDAGERVTVRVLVTNTGSADGTFSASLRLNGVGVSRRAVSIAAGGTRQMTLTQRVETPGTYEVAVGDQYVGTVEVTDDDASGSVTTRALTSVETKETSLGVGMVVVFAVFIIATSYRYQG